METGILAIGLTAVVGLGTWYFMKRNSKQTEVAMENIISENNNHMRYTQEDLKIIADLGLTNAEVGILLNRTPIAIQSQRQRMRKQS